MDHPMIEWWLLPVDFHSNVSWCMLIQCLNRATIFWNCIWLTLKCINKVKDPLPCSFVVLIVQSLNWFRTKHKSLWSHHWSQHPTKSPRACFVWPILHAGLLLPVMLLGSRSVWSASPLPLTAVTRLRSTIPESLFFFTFLNGLVVHCAEWLLFTCTQS